jgi:hypothetical protein
METSKMQAAAAAAQAEADRAEAVAVAETKAAEAAAEAIADAVAAMQDKSKKVVAAPTAAQLAKYAADAASKGEPLFTWPPEGVQVEATARVYYNRCMGPLPSNGQLQLKAGLNKWEQIELYDMQRCVMLRVLPIMRCVVRSVWVLLGAEQVGAELYNMQRCVTLRVLPASCCLAWVACCRAVLLGLCGCCVGLNKWEQIELYDMQRCVAGCVVWGFM